MKRDDRSEQSTDLVIATPSNAQVDPAGEVKAKLAEFRNKLDAFRIRARASQERLDARSAAFRRMNAPEVPSTPNDAAATAPFSAEQDLQKKADRTLDRRAKTDRGVAEDRFEIIMPPEAPAPPKPVRIAARQAAYGALAAGLAVVALLASADALSDRDARSAGDSGRWAHSGTAPFDREADGEIATATVPAARAGTRRKGYLSGAALRSLLRDRPIKCVVDAPLTAGVGVGAAVDEDALRLAASVAEGCVETIAYEPASSLLVREASAPGGASIEINAAFSIEGDAICHQTRGLSALVIGGDMPAEGARSLENLLTASYADLRGAPICHRLRLLGEAEGGPLFRADAFVNGARVVERTDPRPFMMMRRLDRAGM